MTHIPTPKSEIACRRVGSLSILAGFSISFFTRREPALGRVRRTRSTPHPAGDAALEDHEAEHDQFTVDPWSTPGGILGHHLEDQLADFFRDRLSAQRLAHER